MRHPGWRVHRDQSGLASGRAEKAKSVRALGVFQGNAPRIVNMYTWLCTFGAMLLIY